METHNVETRNVFEGGRADVRFRIEALIGSYVPHGGPRTRTWSPTSFDHGATLTRDTDTLTGSAPGLLGITSNERTDGFLNCMIGDNAWLESALMLKENVEVMKHEYKYFYPFNMHSLGKNLIPNHLTFCPYIHATSFPEKK